MRRKSEVKEDDCGSEECDGECVTQRVEQAQTHAFAPRALYARDVGNGCEMVVVEAVPKSQQSAGDQSEFERGGH